MQDVEPIQGDSFNNDFFPSQFYPYTASGTCKKHNYKNKKIFIILIPFLLHIYNDILRIWDDYGHSPRGFCGPFWHLCSITLVIGWLILNFRQDHYHSTTIIILRFLLFIIFVNSITK